MVVIGLTGSLGTGKSTVASIFESFGVETVDADKIVRRLLLPKGGCYSAVVNVFGQGIISDGRIDHHKLGKIVFNDIKKLKKLEAIIHPRVRKEMERTIRLAEKKRRKILLFEVPLLFESGFDRLVDIIITVRATQAQQIERTRRKISLSGAQIRKRLKLQMPLSEKILLSDIIIDNRGTLTNTKAQVKETLKALSFNHNKQ